MNPSSIRHDIMWDATMGVENSQGDRLGRLCFPILVGSSVAGGEWVWLSFCRNPNTTNEFPPPAHTPNLSAGSEVRALMKRACKAQLSQQQQQFLQTEIEADPKLVGRWSFSFLW